VVTAIQEQIQCSADGVPRVERRLGEGEAAVILGPSLAITRRLPLPCGFSEYRSGKKGQRFTTIGASPRYQQEHAQNRLGNLFSDAGTAAEVVK
jgi:hypothetical protein